MEFGGSILIKQYLAFAVTPILFVLHYSIYPRGAMYPTSLVPEAWFHPVVYILGGIVTVFHLVALGSAILNLQILLVSYTISIFPLIEREFRPNLATYKTRESLRELGNLITVYRSIEILHKHVSGLFAPAIIPGKYLSMKLILLCNYTLIMYWKDMHRVTRYIFVAASVGCMGHWIVWLLYAGWLNVCCKETLRSWKFFHSENKKELRILGKVKKSCIPLAFKASCYFTIKRLTVLKFMKKITRNTLKSLLAFK
jgi:hypothetical protein